MSVAVIKASPFPPAYEVLDTVSAPWHMVPGKKVPQVCHIYEVNFCDSTIDAINAEEGDENRAL
jgi:hypothetical protein